MSKQQDDAFTVILKEVMETNGNRPGVYMISGRAVQDPLGDWFFTWEWFWRSEEVIRETPSPG